jgi:SAM-dependent methyltransferase
MTREGYTGTGPGAFTPDGCAVSLYERLPVGDEPSIIEAAIPSGASILELGCGVGRVTHPLIARGFQLTAVDESTEMLSRVTGARTVRSTIEDLNLPDRFDVVLLGSFLVHAPSVAGRLLATCARHVAPGGSVLLQREGSDWHTNVPRSAPLSDGVVHVTSSSEVRPGVRSVLVEYVFPDAHWTHTFLTRPLTDLAFERLLADSRLRLDRYLTDDRIWVLAKPA